MKSRSELRAEATRLIAVALLDSKLTVEELRSVARMIDGGELNSGIHLLVEDFCFNMKHLSPPEKEPSDSPALRILKKLRSRKVSKAGFALMSSEVGVNLEDALRDKSTNLDRMVEQFLFKASDLSLNRLLSLLFDESGQDTFLKGIMSRRS
jgi:hypothetical protein